MKSPKAQIDELKRSPVNQVDGEPAVFKSAQELYRIYYEAGAGPDKEMITYCQTAVRAAHSYFQLRLLGYESVRVYDGSWEEWESDADLPIEK